MTAVRLTPPFPFDSPDYLRDGKRPERIDDLRRQPPALPPAGGGERSFPVSAVIGIRRLISRPGRLHRTARDAGDAREAA
jgi:hypothetical protein